MEKERQNIKCDVHTCKHCNCEENHCNLREVEIKNQSGLTSQKEGTICASYKLDEEKMKEEN